MSSPEDGGYAGLLDQVGELEAALSGHRRHVCDAASMSALPAMVRELKELDHRVADIREECERHLALPGQVPL